MSNAKYIRVLPILVREEHIATSPTLYQVENMYRSAPTLMDVRKVSIDCLIYRMANGRTILAQDQEKLRSSLPDDYFAIGQENDETQTIQHSILVNLAKADTANIYKELKETSEQTEPLLVTTSGIVVNGNRRLAAMRELRFQGSDKFQHIKVIVLPRGCNEDDVNSLEDSLQLAPDLKLKYHWVAAARILESRLAGKSEAEAAGVRKAWGLTQTQVAERQRTLLLVKEYLELFGNTTESIDSLEKSEQAFIRLGDYLKSVDPDSPFYDIDKLIGFRAIENSASFGRGRFAYDVIPKIADLRSEIIGEVQNNEPEQPNDTLLGLLALRSEQKQIPAEIQVVSDKFSDTGRDVLIELTSAWSTVKHRQSAEEAAVKPLQLAQQAQKALYDIALDGLNATGMDQLEKVFENITDRVASLREDIEILTRDEPN